MSREIILAKLHCNHVIFMPLIEEDGRGYCPFHDELVRVMWMKRKGENLPDNDLDFSSIFGDI